MCESSVQKSIGSEWTWGEKGADKGRADCVRAGEQECRRMKIGQDALLTGTKERKRARETVAIVFEQEKGATNGTREGATTSLLKRSGAVGIRSRGSNDNDLDGESQRRGQQPSRDETWNLVRSVLSSNEERLIMGCIMVPIMVEDTDVGDKLRGMDRCPLQHRLLMDIMNE